MGNWRLRTPLQAELRLAFFFPNTQTSTRADTYMAGTENSSPREDNGQIAKLTTHLLLTPKSKWSASTSPLLIRLLWHTNYLSTRTVSRLRLIKIKQAWQILVKKNWGSHDNENKDCYHLCEMTCRLVQMPSSGSRFLWNVGNLQPYYKTSYSRRQSPPNVSLTAKYRYH